MEVELVAFVGEGVHSHGGNQQKYTEPLVGKAVQEGHALARD